MGITQSVVLRDMVLLLLARGAKPTLEALGAAVHGDIELNATRKTGITHIMIDEAKRIGMPFSKTTLNEAISQNYIGHNMYVFIMMVDAGADPNVRIYCQLSRGCNALSVACRKPELSNNTIVDFIDRGSHVRLPDNHGNTPLHEAAKSGSLDAVLALDSAGASVYDRNEKDQTALHLACGSFWQYNTVKGYEQFLSNTSNRILTG